MKRRIIAIIFILSLCIVSCTENNTKISVYSEGYLTTVYDLMPRLLKRVLNEEEFVNTCYSLGFVPINENTNSDSQTPTSLPEYLESQRKNLNHSDKEIIKIASFNIQVFGRSKVKKEDVMKNLIEIIQDFDMVAIQEIRDKTGQAIQILVDQLGREKWNLAIGPSLGRTISKEQYAFIYRKDKFDLQFCESWPDPEDLLHREPYLCTFESGQFEFTIINIHTDPDIVEQEINVLDDIYNYYSSKHEHLLLMGDLNAGPVDFDDITRIQNVAWAIPQSSRTNTRGTKNYDNIIYNYKLLDEFSSGYVYDMQKELGISERNALRISDHNPVVIELLITADDSRIAL